MQPFADVSPPRQTRGVGLVDRIIRGERVGSEALWVVGLQDGVGAGEGSGDGVEVSGAEVGEVADRIREATDVPIRSPESCRVCPVAADSKGC